MTTYLTREQVFQLNEKHGWFQFGDAQSDVSKAFAQDAIAMHERMRAAAPELLAALAELLPMFAEWHSDFPEHVGDKEKPALQLARAAIAKATGAAS